MRLIEWAGAAPESTAGALLIPAVVASKLGLAALVALFAGELGMQDRGRGALLAVLALLPGGGWLVVSLVLDFCPSSLAAIGRRTVSRQQYTTLMLVVGGIPIVLALFLTIVSPDYMAQLMLDSAHGGADVPGMGIPCGWPLLAVALTAIVLGLSPLRTMIRNRLRVIPFLTLLLMVLGALYAACQIFLLGPAVIRLYQLFLSGAFDW